jgi:hypothetical protein
VLRALRLWRALPAMLVRQPRGVSCRVVPASERLTHVAIGVEGVRGLQLRSVARCRSLSVREEGSAASYGHESGGAWLRPHHHGGRKNRHASGLGPCTILSFPLLWRYLAFGVYLHYVCKES